MNKAIQQQNRPYRWYKIQRCSNWRRDEVNSDLYCLHIVLSCVSILLIIFSTVFHLEVQANEVSLWWVAIFSIWFASSLFSCITGKGVTLKIFCHPWSTPWLRGEHSKMVWAESRCLDCLLNFCLLFPVSVTWKTQSQMKEHTQCLSSLMCLELPIFFPKEVVPILL